MTVTDNLADRTHRNDLGEQAARRLVEFLETGDAHPDLFTADIFCDFTMPTWRLQAQGRNDAIGLRLHGHPGASKVTRRRLQPTAEGFALEVEERWTDAQDDWYCRECVLATLRGASISAMSVYCTGDWSAERQRKHAAEVKLLRP